MYISHCFRRTLSQYSVSKILSEAFDRRNVGEKVLVQGWISSVRVQKEFVFLHITDGVTSKKLQVVIPKSSGILSDECSVYSSVEICGQIVQSPKQGQPVELAAESLKVISTGAESPDFPFNSKCSHPPEYIRRFPHLRAKAPTFASTLRLRSLLSSGVHQYFSNNDFVHVHTPVMTSNDCEGGGEIFMVKPDSSHLCRKMAKEGKDDSEAYFDKKAFLTVSGQLHLEALCSGISKVYNFNPAFRAENSRSRRHLAEFLMVEAELAFVSEMSQILEVMEGLIQHCAKLVLEKGLDDVAILERINKVQIKDHLAEISTTKFQTITYADSIKVLLENSEKFQTFPKDGEGLGKEHEVFLTKYCGDRPTFVVDWPAHLKPFYARKCGHDRNLVSAVDLLVPDVGELCGGSLREFDYLELRSRLEELGLVNQLSWYCDLRRHGSSPTGGFGLGFERLISYFFKIGHVRDVIPFPRWPHNCDL